MVDETALYSISSPLPHSNMNADNAIEVGVVMYKMQNLKRTCEKNLLI